MGILLGVLSADGARGLSEQLQGERLSPGRGWPVSIA
jgi:hypothetical protein